MKNPELIVELDDSMPLGELLEDARQGQPVKRSAHIGNMYGADLIQAAMGMRMVLVDANYGDRDELYFPHLVVNQDTDPVVVAPSDRLSMVNRTFDGQALNQFCVESLTRAFGNRNIVSDSDMLLANEELVCAVLDVLIKKFPAQFARRVDSDGRPRQSLVAPQDVEDLLLFGGDPKTGVVVPNEMNILLDFLLEAINFDTGSITHISGPTMFKYIQTKLDLLSRMYGSVIDSGVADLPDRLNVKLVPAAGVRYVAKASQREELDALLALDEAYQVICGATKTIRKAMAATGKCNKDDFSAGSSAERLIRSRLVEQFGSLAGLNYVKSSEKNFPNFTSQYSALEDGADGTTGSGLYIPKAAIEQPIRDVTSNFARLEKLR